MNIDHHTRAAIRTQQNRAALDGDFSLSPEAALALALQRDDDFAIRYETEHRREFPPPLTRRCGRVTWKSSPCQRGSSIVDAAAMAFAALGLAMQVAA